MATSGKVDDSSPTRAARLRCPALAGSVLDLRKLLTERFPHAPAAAATQLVTGLAFLDEAIAGGLPKGAITELISPEVSAGSASLIHALLETAQRDCYFWVRCTKALEAIKAADLLLRNGNFPLVIVDLVPNAPEELRKIPQTNWYRLQRLVESTSTACLVLTRQGRVSSAQLKIVLENVWSLESFEQEDAISRLRIRVQRSHLPREEIKIGGAG